MNPTTTADADLIAQRLEELRSEFDSGFARAWTAERSEPNAILCFLAEGSRFAAELTGLQAVSKSGRLAAVPSRSPALLGLTVVQAKLMPVYSLARLTGTSASAAEPSWLAVLRGALPAAIAIDAIAGYADRRSVSGASAGDAPAFIRGSVQLGSDLYALLDCQALYAAIVSPAGSMKGPGHRS